MLGRSPRKEVGAVLEGLGLEGGDTHTLTLTLTLTHTLSLSLTHTHNHNVTLPGSWSGPSRTWP